MQDDTPAQPTAGQTDAPGWQYTGGTPAQPQPAAAPHSGDTVSWTASEFIAHAKGSSWYFLLALATLGAGVAAYIITHGDKLTTVIIGVTGILFGIMAARQPRELPYRIDSDGIKIGDKQYPYASFKSFSVVQEEGLESIWLLPLQRFTPGLSIYFSPGDRDKIVNILGEYLPIDDRQLDFVDKLMHKVRF